MTLSQLINSADLAPALPESTAQTVAAELSSISGLQVYPHSLTAAQNTLFFLGRSGDKKQLGYFIRHAQQQFFR